MSDPMTNVDIEDVLASIRRLVSEDARPRAVPTQPAVQAPAALRVTGQPQVAPRDADLRAAPVQAAVPSRAQTLTLQGDRLVLTPALRVLGSEADPPGAGDLAEPVAEPWTDPAARLADLWPEDAVAPAALPQDSDDAQARPAQDAAETGADQGPQDSAAHGDAAHGDADPGDWHENAGLTDAAASDAASAIASDTGHLPDMQGVADFAADSGGDTGARSDDAPLDLVDDALPWEDIQDDLDRDLMRDGPEDAQAMGAAGDRIAEPAAQPAAEPAAWAHAAEAPAAPQDSAATQAPGATDDPLAPDMDDLLAEDSVIDEAMLRDLVADIVRQELMGALGERITRNVRKLVRREIHRALSAQDFD